MKLMSMADAFWRAAAYCVHPRVIALSVLPLLLIVALSWGLGWLYWDAAVSGVSRWLDSYELLTAFWRWLDHLGLPDLKVVLAPLIVIALSTPLIVLASLTSVALLMTPALVSLVAERRFPGLQRLRGASFVGSLLWSAGSMALALLALLASIPLWLVPPLVLVLPPLIWGWLTYRVMAFDALAEHASRDERAQLMRELRSPLLLMGVVCGFLGAAPGLIWASGALLAAAFVILVPLAIWIYTLVFAFSSLWFTHFCLEALQRLRDQRSQGEVVDSPDTAVRDATSPPSPVLPSPETRLS